MSRNQNRAADAMDADVFDTQGLFNEHIAAIQGDIAANPQFRQDVRACKELRANNKKAWAQLNERREYTAEQKAERRLKRLQNLAKNCAKARAKFAAEGLDQEEAVNRLIAEDARNRL